MVMKEQCQYLGCVDRDRPHKTVCCFILMKRCRLPACQSQQGHIRKSHENLSHLSLEGQRVELRRAFQEMEGGLTGREKEVIEKYEVEREKEREAKVTPIGKERTI